jgi:hypothetical protein
MTLTIDAQKIQGFLSVAKHLGLLLSERSASDSPNVEPHLHNVERRSEDPRRLPSQGTSNTIQSSDEADAAGRDVTDEGRTGSPSKAELVEVLRSMLVGDEASPRRSDCGWAIGPSTTGLVVLVVDATEALFDELRIPKGKSIPCTTGPVDREEAYGYLMADVLGSALLSATGARSVGEKVRKRNAAHAAALPEAKDSEEAGEARRREGRSQ